MTDNNNKPERMVPMPVPDDIKPKNVLGSLVGKVEEKLAGDVEQAKNVRFAALVERGRLAGQYQNAEADYLLAAGRTENIKEEIEADRQKHITAGQEAITRRKTLIAEADQLVRDFEGKKEQATTIKEEAITAQVKTKLERAELQRKLDAIEKANVDEELAELAVQKDQVEQEIISQSAKLEELRMDDTAEGIATKRALKNTLNDLETTLGAIMQKISDRSGKV